MRPAFDDYVLARGTGLQRFAFVLCGDHHLAQDLVQEALAKAHRRWRHIESDDPEAYVKQAIVRTHLSWWRRRSNHESPVEQIPPAGVPDSAEILAVRDELLRMLGALPPAQRKVLVLRYFNDLDDGQIAAAMGVSRSTVRVHAHRGLAALRAAAVAVVLVVIVALVYVFADKPDVPPAPPIESASPRPRASRLVPARYELPSFPYTPSGIAGEPQVEANGGDLRLAYKGEELWLELLPDKRDWDWEGTDSSTTVGGKPATVRIRGEQIGLRWSMDGRWVYVRSFAGRGLAQVKAIAESLQAQPIAVKVGYSIAFAPPGAQLTSIDERSATFADGSVGVSVTFGVAAWGATNPGTLLTVNGHQAQLNSERGVLSVFYAPGKMYTVRLEGGTRNLTDDELIHFAEGIRIDPT